MSEPTTTIRVKGKIEDALNATQVDLEVEVPLRPMAALLLKTRMIGAPPTEEVDALVKAMLGD